MDGACRFPPKRPSRKNQEKIIGEPQSRMGLRFPLSGRAFDYHQEQSICECKKKESTEDYTTVLCLPLDWRSNLSSITVVTLQMASTTSQIKPNHVFCCRSCCTGSLGFAGSSCVVDRLATVRKLTLPRSRYYANDRKFSVRMKTLIQVHSWHGVS